jgi:Flp pilus assembly pilin Flp
MSPENLRNAVAYFLESEERATMTEYVFLIALNTPGCFTVVPALSTSVLQPYQAATNALHQALED